jgi:hypothetical protein
MSGTKVSTANSIQTMIKELNCCRFGFFQNQQNIEPRYQQISLNPEERKNYNKFFSPNAEDEGV